MPCIYTIVFRAWKGRSESFGDISEKYTCSAIDFASRSRRVILLDVLAIDKLPLLGDISRYLFGRFYARAEHSSARRHLYLSFVFCVLSFVVCLLSFGFCFQFNQNESREAT